MGAGALVEPLVVIVLLFGGTWINRNKEYSVFGRRSSRWTDKDRPLSERLDSPDSSVSSVEAGSLLEPQEPRWRKRPLRLLSLEILVTSPNTKQFQDRFLSRVLRKFPFLVEAWYWALIYWVYQLGRAFTAVTLVEGTVHVARRHALQLIALERQFNIFYELQIQQAFLKHPIIMHWINRIYSFIHIPGTIAFLVGLYWYTTVRNRVQEQRSSKDLNEATGSPAGPKLFEARRRTMAVCNLIAFIIFTAWPCMPPRLLSDKSVTGPSGELARSYGFVDTVHGAEGESSVWTQNKFCNQYAAMPSLHFGYSLLVGLTVATLPLAPRHRRSRTLYVPALGRIRLPSIQRLLCITFGLSYSLTILIAIISTANHFILDAVAGAMVCAVGWTCNRILLNLLPIEDYFLWCVRIHKPQRYISEHTVEHGEDENKILVDEA